MNEIIILSVFHKEYKYNKECQWIKPIAVGNFICNDFLSDKIGNNISNLNYTYAELTALYWMYKNLSYDYYGLCHYRRYFNFMNENINSFEDIFSLRQNEACLKILKNYDVILPNRMSLPSEMEEHYKGCHVAKHYDIFIEEVKKIYPKKDVDTANKTTSFYANNCFVTNSVIFNRYCSELFHILSNVYYKVDVNINKPDKRHMGYLGERFLNIFFNINGYTICNCPIIQI